MKVKILTLAMAFVLLASFGQAQAATNEGDQELAVGFVFTKVEDVQTATLQVNLGYFVTDAIEIRGSASLTWFDFDGDDAITLYLGLDGLYHFNTEGEAVPYVGVGGLFNQTEADDFDESTFGVKGIAGVRVFIDENTSINIEYNILKLFGDEFEDNDIVHFLIIQLSYFF